MKRSDDICAYKRCDCSLEAHRPIIRGEQRFCSERCADGRGCDHEGCNCGNFPAAEPAPPYA